MQVGARATPHDAEQVHLGEEGVGCGGRELEELSEAPAAVARCGRRPDSSTSQAPDSRRCCSSGASSASLGSSPSVTKPSRTISADSGATFGQQLGLGRYSLIENDFALSGSRLPTVLRRQRAGQASIQHVHDEVSQRCLIERAGRRRLEVAPAGALGYWEMRLSGSSLRGWAPERPEGGGRVSGSTTGARPDDGGLGSDGGSESVSCPLANRDSRAECSGAFQHVRGWNAAVPDATWGRRCCARQPSRETRFQARASVCRREVPWARPSRGGRVEWSALGAASERRRSFRARCTAASSSPGVDHDGGDRSQRVGT